MAHEIQDTNDVHGRVRGAILDGVLAPGAIISQVALAEELGISRTKLRGAVRMLQTERLVEAEPNHRMRVASVTPEDLEALYVMRVTLEAQAVRLSVPRMTPADLARMEGHIAKMAHYAQEHDRRRWLAPHRQFHRALTAWAGARVNVTLSQLFDHAERYRRLCMGDRPSASAGVAHREVLNACKARDRDRSATLLATHLAGTGLELLALLAPAYEPVLLKAAVGDAGATRPRSCPARVSAIRTRRCAPGA